MNDTVRDYEERLRLAMISSNIINIINQNIRVIGDVAVVISDAELDVVINNENLSDHLIYTRIWQKFDDEWKLVGGQAT